MPFFVVLFIIVVLAGLALAYWVLRSRSESSCLERAEDAEGLWETEPEKARRLCQGVLDRLGGKSGRRKLTPTGHQALAQAYLVLALLDHREGSTEDAWAHLDRLRELPLEGEPIDRRLLLFYTINASTSAEAFETYLTCGRSEWVGGDPALEKCIASGLRGCCALRAEMTEAELVQQIKRNQDVRKIFPGKTWSLRAEAQAWSRLQKPQRARLVLEELVALHPESVPDRIALVGALIASGEKDRARQELTNLVRQSPDDYELLLDVAKQQIALGDRQAATGNINRVLAEAPSLQGQAWTLIGTVALQGKRAAKAIPWLKKALDAEPENIQARIALAEAHSQNGEPAEAVQYLKPASEQPLPPEQEYALACALFNHQQWVEAAGHFEQCRQADFRAAACALFRLRALLKASDAGAADALQKAEALNPDHPDLAFYRGVLLYQGGAYQKALPHFARAYTAAGKIKDETLLKRAKLNVVACYWQLAVQHAAQRRYADAAKAWEVVQKNLLKHPRLADIAQALARCHFLTGFDRYKRGGPKAAAEAIEPVSKSHQLHPDPIVRSFLAALCLREGRRGEAAEHYGELLKGAPKQEGLQFAWGLSALQTDRAGQAGETLGQLARGGGPYALRAALALSAGHIERGEYQPAVTVLMAARKFPDAPKDPHYGELCRTAVLSALRSGDNDWAKRLALGLYGGGSGLGANLLLGCLLAETGDYEQALPLLEKADDEAHGRPAGKRAGPLTVLLLEQPEEGASGRDRPRELLGQIYRLAVRQRCEKEDYDGMKELLQRALKRQEDAELHKLHKLVTTASRAGVLGNGTDDGQSDDQIIPLLDELHGAAAKPDIHLVRSTMVAHHRKACALAKEGKHKPARNHWERAHGIWAKQIADKKAFWKDYRDACNDGKQYQIQMSEADLGKTLQRRMAGVCVGLTGKAVAQQGYDEAEFYWDEARKIAPDSVCKELFKEVVNVVDLVAQFNVRTNPGKVVRLYRFLYEKIDHCEEYRKELEQLEIVEAVEGIKQGEYDLARKMGKKGSKETRKILADHALENAIQALKGNEIRRCHRLLELTGEFDSDWIKLAAKIKLLGDTVLNVIVSGVQGHDLVKVLVLANPAKADVILFQVVLGYAEINVQMTGGLDAYKVRQTLDQVIMAMVQAMLKG